MRQFILIATLALAGCSDFPDLDAAVSDQARRADFPRLLPMETLLAQVPARQPGGLGVGTLESRARALKARAARLRARAVLTPATRARLMQAVARHN